MKFLFLFGAMISSVVGIAQDSTHTDASLSTATVYFGYGAELTHLAKTNVSAQTKFIVVNQLSTDIDISSLQISCPEKVALLSSHYDVFYPEAPIIARNMEVERLQDSIVILNDEISRIDNLIAIEQETLTQTGKLIEATMANNGNKEVLSAEVLKLVEFYNAKISKAKTNMFDFKKQQQRHRLRIGTLDKRIADLKGAPPASKKPYGRLTLQVMCQSSEQIPISISYYTNSSGWTPVYDVRVDSKANKVKLVYKASLMQLTGIDWKKVKLTLSTGTPTFGVSAPVLTPWALQLYVPGLYTGLQKRAALANTRINQIQSQLEGRTGGLFLNNGYANNYELVDQSVSRDTLIRPSTIQEFTTLNEGQLNTNFDIDLPYDIASDGQLHSVTIKDEDINCILKSYSVPRMDKETYLLAEIADWQNLDLLPGDANIIMDETYIGKSLIDPNSTSDTLNLSLGKDRRVVVKRSIVKELSSLKTSGGNNKQTFTYEITVKNNKTTDVTMLLKDQYPLSTIKEVEVKLEDQGDASVNTETGILTWKISLKPGESRKFRFGYSVKFPKDKKIINLK